MTLVELVIAIGIGAFVFSAVAAALATGLRSLAAQKTRTQGNELATLGIEDLQRYSYGALGVCGFASPVPAGFTDVAKAAGCGTTIVDPAYGDNPCNPPTTPVGVPSGRYECTRLNTTYTVRRYVGWTDAAQTAKRMAVVVEWVDLAGKHQVAQQTSVRSPDVGSSVGLDPPKFLTSPAPTLTGGPTFTLDGAGRNPALTFTAQVENATVSDRVFVTFNALSGGEITATTFGLGGSTTGTPEVTAWTGTVAAGLHEMPVGSQFIVFTVVGQLDGKTSSEAVGSYTFCASLGPCPPSDLPVITATPQVNGATTTTITLTGTGGLSSTAEVTATTTNIDPALGDSVSFRFTTSEGSVTTAMTAQSCDTTTGECSWRGVIDPASGYSFPAGDQEFDVIAERVARGSTPASTAARQTGTVTFT